MKKKIKTRIIIILVVAVFLGTIFSGGIMASASGDENYNDYSNEYAQGEQPENIPIMNRLEDRTRNKDG